MAQSKATPVAPNQKTPGNKRMLMIGVALLVALLLLLAGAVGYLFLNKNKEHGDEPTLGAPGTLPVFEKMEPFVINLSGEQGGMLQVEMETELAAESSREIVKAYNPKVRSAIIMLLSSKKPSDLATSDGREELADEIKEEANDVLGYAPNPKKKNKRSRPEDDGPVLAVLFNQFIVQ